LIRARDNTRHHALLEAFLASQSQQEGQSRKVADPGTMRHNESQEQQQKQEPYELDISDLLIENALVLIEPIICGIRNQLIELLETWFRWLPIIVPTSCRPRLIWAREPFGE
jgi:hypothetical protein